MPQPLSTPAIPIPRWLVILGSLAITFHLGSVVFGALAAPSGPWPTMEGNIPIPPPRFVVAVNNKTGPYLNYLKMTDNYHFSSNRPGTPGVYVEVRLKDAAGKEIANLKVPDEEANPWVRHREELLVRWLGGDQPVMQPQAEQIAAPGKQVREVTIWDPLDGQFNSMKLKKIPEHLIARDRPTVAPSEFSLLLARSFARYLCRTHGAASAEIIRHHKEPMGPDVLFEKNIPAEAFGEISSNFGELSK